MPLATRLHRIASVRLGRPPYEVAEPEVATELGALAEPPVTDAATVELLVRAVSGTVDALPDTVAARLTAGLGLPAGALDAGTDFSDVEQDLLRRFLDERGVVGIRSCRGGRGRTALLALLGLVDRGAAGPAGTGVA